MAGVGVASASGWVRIEVDGPETVESTVPIVSLAPPVGADGADDLRSLATMRVLRVLEKRHAKGYVAVSQMQ